MSAVLSNEKKEKNKAKKAVIAPTLPGGPILQVVLHDTVIFPEGGGQPTDTGKLQLKCDPERLWKVVQAKRHGGHAVHYVEVPAGHLPDYHPG